LTPAIETIELTKDYAVGFWRKRPRRVLDRLSLKVEPGEVFGFLGPNGAGKTTTLKLLLQLVFPTSGEARILGRPAGDLEAKRDHFAKGLAKIGFDVVPCAGTYFITADMRSVGVEDDDVTACRRLTLAGWRFTIASES